MKTAFAYLVLFAILGFFFRGMRGPREAEQVAVAWWTFVLTFLGLLIFDSLPG